MKLHESVIPRMHICRHGNLKTYTQKPGKTLDYHRILHASLVIVCHYIRLEIGNLQTSDIKLWSLYRYSFIRSLYCDNCILYIEGVYILKDFE